MGRYELILRRVLTGTNDSNIAFRDLCTLVSALGFTLRTNGSHHIFFMESIPEILNLQPKRGKAKPYQVKQVRTVIVRYKLAERP